MNHIDILNLLISTYGYNSYLEIGCQKDFCFKKIKCKDKVGINPENGGTLKMTSNEYFLSIKDNKIKFDLIFIDGLHHADQVYIDINNALKYLSDKGTIVVHDLLPTSKEIQAVPRISKVWTGDGWKAWLKIKNKPALNMYVIDTDWGCGIIQKDKQRKAEKLIFKLQKKIGRFKEKRTIFYFVLIYFKMIYLNLSF